MSRRETMRYELKLRGTRRTAVWEGASGIDAAERYVDAHPEDAVIAWRVYAETNILVPGIPAGTW